MLAHLSDRSHRLRYMLSWACSAEALEREARRMLVGATGDCIMLIALGRQGGHETALAVGELAHIQTGHRHMLMITKLKGTFPNGISYTA
jgi:hypothetical protein